MKHYRIIKQPERYYLSVKGLEKAEKCLKRLVLFSKTEGREDFLILLTYILLLPNQNCYFFSTQKVTMKRILPSLPFLPVGLNDAVKILFYDKSFNWMTSWHYRTLERKPNVYTTNLEKEEILSFIYPTIIWELMFQTQHWVLRIKVQKCENSYHCPIHVYRQYN